MARKGQAAPARRDAALEKIEEHLKEQGKEIKKGQWNTFVALGFSVMLVGVTTLISKVVASLWVGKCVNNVWAYTSDAWVYAFIFLEGVAMMAYGYVRKSRIK